MAAKQEVEKTANQSSKKAKKQKKENQPDQIYKVVFSNFRSGLFGKLLSPLPLDLLLLVYTSTFW